MNIRTERVGRCNLLVENPLPICHILGRVHVIQKKFLTSLLEFVIPHVNVAEKLDRFCMLKGTYT